MKMKFGKAVRYKPSLLEGAHDGQAQGRARDQQAAVFSGNPLHIVWSHLSSSESTYNHGSRRHVHDTERQEHESRKRSKYHCTPLPDDYIKARILPPLGGGLAEVRPEVQHFAEETSRRPFTLNLGDDPRNQVVTRPREVDPSFRSSSNPLLITDDTASIKLRMGKRPLELPRSPTAESPPTFTSSPSFGRYSHEESKVGKRVAMQAQEYDPLFIKATNAGRELHRAPSGSEGHFFLAQQQDLARKLGRSL